MAGSVMTVGMVGAAAALTFAVAAVAAASVVGQRASGAADSAALAAADAASGAVSGVPCERAEEVASAVGATLTSCRLDGLIATVTVSVPFGSLSAEAASRAGPP